MCLLFLLFTISAFAQDTAIEQVYASCREHLLKVEGGIERVESHESDGKLQLCIPSRDRKRNAQDIQKEVAKLRKDRLEKAFPKYLNSKTSLELAVT